MSFEFAFLNFLQTLHNPVLNAIMVAVTSLGNGGVLWVAIGAVMLIKPKTRKLGLMLLLALALNGVVCNFVLKALINRPRPCDINTHVALLIKRPFGSSFPSGHTAASFTAVTVFYMLKQHKLFVFSLIISLLIGFSRMYLYVHFPTDVLGGVVIGILIGYVAVKLLEAKVPYFADQNE